jgi:hypothetical protein
MDHSNNEYLTTALVAQRYKKTPKTIREWELAGILPAPDRINGRKHWKLSKLEAAERAGLSRRKPERAESGHV